MNFSLKKLLAVVLFPALLFAATEEQTGFSGAVGFNGMGARSADLYFSNAKPFNLTGTRWCLRDNADASCSFIVNAVFNYYSGRNYYFIYPTVTGVETSVTSDGLMKVTVSFTPPQCSYNEYQRTGSTCGWSGVQVNVTANYDERVVIGNPNFNGITKTFSFTKENTDWMDLHLLINNKTAYDVRMTKSGNTFTYTLPVMDTTLNNGIAVKYYTNSFGSGTATLSPEVTFVATGVTPFITSSSVDGVSNVITLQTKVKPTSVIVHYTINNEAQQNVWMTVNNDLTSTYTIPGTSVAGKSVKYSFTVFVDGQAQDFPVTTVTP